MKSIKSVVAGAVLACSASSVYAIGNFDPKVFTKAMQPEFNAMTEDFGAALSYKAITPAEPLGLIGFDFGLELTATKLSSIDKWGNAIGNKDLSYLPLPKLHVHKGLPFGIDLGAVYSQVPSTDIQYWGGEIRYSFVSGNLAIPAVAVRGSYTQLVGIDELDLTTKGLELTVSKGFLLLTPYAGIGQIWSNASLDYTYTESTTSQDVNVKLDGDAAMFKWFVGLNINLGLMNIVFEADQTGESMSYSGKLGFRF